MVLKFIVCQIYVQLNDLDNILIEMKYNRGQIRAVLSVITIIDWSFCDTSKSLLNGSDEYVDFMSNETEGFTISFLI